MARSWFWLLASSALPAALGAWSCGTDAVGIEACREIEYARCEAAVHCGLIEDSAACKTYFHDHCLHGVRLEESPSRGAVNRCVRVLEAAGRCADDEGQNATIDECDDELSDADASKACDIIDEPQLAPDCAFLNVDQEEEEDGEETADEEPEPEPDAG